MGVKQILLDLYDHPEEFFPLIQVKMMANKAKKLPKDKSSAFCYDILNKVSRSFAIVIQQLPVELRDAVCIFYLVLRALDTIEDDMSIPQKEKLPQLLDFYTKCTDRSYTHTCGEKDYKTLMANYPMVVDVFLTLKKEYQDVIIDITKRMGAGMAEFIPKEVITVADYDKYCHYVAGLVGIGLTNLFVSSGMEDPQTEELSNLMGLFLQKTNIIRDYLEDINEEPAPRMFWPRDIWSKYGEKLEDFKEEENEKQAVHCLNHLVTNALEHALSSLEYMSKLKQREIFKFCAIPQVMAISTLALIYDNDEVFWRTGVKVRKGLAARIITETPNMNAVYYWFCHFARDIGSKVKPGRDPNGRKTLELIEKIEETCRKGLREGGVKRDLSSGDHMDTPADGCCMWLRSASEKRPRPSESVTKRPTKRPTRRTTD
eukprot:CAMPEP_0197856264 /NCGR_PEP_ID=MMETSP1438-20131217/28246_1 /TAXON_ID=1461541 /ORGANISM="Pterosperma sp., Strain CCMP1384" /LENGTH=429 /DNA_ID=CAMNT_0043471669 /DNA_START=150 /DNA_END=1439 /DNA_ORIENTATION=+